MKMKKFLLTVSFAALVGYSASALKQTPLMLETDQDISAPSSLFMPLETKDPFALNTASPFHKETFIEEDDKAVLIDWSAPENKPASNIKVAETTFDELDEALTMAQLAYKIVDDPLHFAELVEAEEKSGSKITYFGKNQGVIVQKKDGRVFVSYKGTSTFSDALTDLQFWGYHDNEMDLMGHYGFIQYYKSSRDEVLNTLKNIASERNQSLQDLDIHFVGHSLGGAGATIAAADFAKNFNVKSKLTTHGAPRALSIADAEDLTASGKVIAHRVVNSNDPVPLVLPESISGYQGVGHKIMIPVEGGSLIDVSKHYLTAYQEMLIERSYRAAALDEEGLVAFAEHHKTKEKNGFRTGRAWVNHSIERPTIQLLSSMSRGIWNGFSYMGSFVPSFY